MEYFSESGNLVYAITNSKNRRSSEDVQIRVPLKGDALKKYLKMKKAGENESDMFSILFPDRDTTIAVLVGSRKIEIEVDELSKPQVVDLLTKEIEIELQSIERMTLNDLRELLLRIRSLKP